MFWLDSNINNLTDMIFDNIQWLAGLTQFTPSGSLVRLFCRSSVLSFFRSFARSHGHAGAGLRACGRARLQAFVRSLVPLFCWFLRLFAPFVSFDLTFTQVVRS